MRKVNIGKRIMWANRMKGYAAWVQFLANMVTVVIVADISMPILNGIEAVRQIRKKDKQVKVVFLTMHPDVTYAASAFEAGASGYVLKHSAPSELVIAIHEALKGHVYVTPVIAGELMGAYRKGFAQKTANVELTSRQREVLQLAAEGQSAKQIASTLGISPRTAEFHKYQAMEALGLHSNAELIHFAIKHGLVEL